LYRIPLGIDTNADGVSDGWSSSTAAAITADYSIDNKGQKIEITGGTSTSGNGAAVVKNNIACNVGNILTFKCKIKKPNGLKLNVRINWYNGGSYVASSGIATDANAYNDYAEFSITGTAPANATNCRPELRLTPISTGDTGSAWFKDASLTINS
jgi:hypothetical protein